MTIKQFGLVCDGCDKMIGISDPNESFFVLRLRGLDGDFHVCSECNPDVSQAIGKQDYRLLPNGPLRNLYESMEENHE